PSHGRTVRDAADGSDCHRAVRLWQSLTSGEGHAMRVFVTGASGHIGRALVAELRGAGHEVVGLARSDPSPAALTALGAEVHRGDRDALDGLARAASAADAVAHLAYKHELMQAGDYAGPATADLAAVEAIGAALAGTGKPFTIASGTALL